jgi:hypothetical protein
MDKDMSVRKQPTTPSSTSRKPASRLGASGGGGDGWPEVTSKSSTISLTSSGKKRKRESMGNSASPIAPQVNVDPSTGTLSHPVRPSREKGHGSNMELLSSLMNDLNTDTYKLLGAANYSSLVAENFSGSMMALPMANHVPATGTSTSLALPLYESISRVVNGDASDVSILLVLRRYLQCFIVRPTTDDVVSSVLRLLHGVLTIKYEVHLLSVSKRKTDTLMCKSNINNAANRSLSRLGFVSGRSEAELQRVEHHLCCLSGVSLPVNIGPGSDTELDEEHQISAFISELIHMANLLEGGSLLTLLNCLKIVALHTNKHHLIHFKPLMTCGVFKKIFRPANIGAHTSAGIDIQAVTIDLLASLLHSPVLLDLSTASVQSDASSEDLDPPPPSTTDVSVMALVSTTLDSDHTGEASDSRCNRIQLGLKVIRLFSGIALVHRENGFINHRKEGENTLQYIIPSLITMMYKETNVALDQESQGHFLEEEHTLRLSLINESLSLLNLFSVQSVWRISLRDVIVHTGSISRLLSVAWRLQEYYRDAPVVSSELLNDIENKIETLLVNIEYGDAT